MLRTTRKVRECQRGDLSVFEAFPEDGLQSKESLKSKDKSLDVNSHNVFDYDPDLYTKMVRYPLEVLAIFDIVLMNMVGRINPLFEKHIQTRIFNLKSSTCCTSG